MKDLLNILPPSHRWGARLAVGGLTLLSIFWAGATFLYLENHATQRRAELELNQALLLENTTAHFDGVLAHIHSDIRLLTRFSQQNLHAHGLEESLSPIANAAKAMVSGNPNYQRIRLISLDGDSLVSASRNPDDQIISRLLPESTLTPALEKAILRSAGLENAVLFTPLQLDTVTRSWMIQGVAPFSIAQPRFSGVVVIEARPVRLLDAVHRNGFDLLQVSHGAPSDTSSPEDPQHLHVAGQRPDLVLPFAKLWNNLVANNAGIPVAPSPDHPNFRVLNQNPLPGMDPIIHAEDKLILLASTECASERVAQASFRNRTLALWACVQFILCGATIVYMVQHRRRDGLHRSIAREKTFLNTLLNALPIPVYFHNLDRSEVGFNQAFGDFWRSGDAPENIDLKSASRTNLHGFLHDQDTINHQLLEGDKDTVSFNLELPCHNGEIRHLVIHKARYRDHDSRVAGIIGLIVDVTDNYRYEIALRKAVTETEKASQAKSAFLAAMSHEIRTPMNGILGMASLLYETRLSDSQKDYVQTISASGETLLNLINDILDFAKIQSDRIELESKTFDLESLICELLDLFASPAEDNHNTLCYRIEPGFKPAMQGDATRVRQIVQNLLSNAIKFTAKGEVCVVLAPHPDDPSRADISIKDTGIGIKPDLIPDLFSPFMQEDSSITRRFGGSGMGLVISKGLIDLMQGTLAVESKPGTGSTFTVTLPRGAPDENLPSTAQMRVLPGLSVLIIDKHPGPLKAASEFTRSWGMEAIPFSDPAKALSWMANGNRADIILIDYDTPPQAGLRLGDDLHALLQTRQANTPLILMTPSSVQGVSAPFHASVSKPLHRKNLQRIFIEAASRQSHSLPRMVDAESVTAPLSEFARKHPMEILVAEDNKVNQKVCDLMLRKLGYKATFACDGDEAWKIFESTRPQVVLMDIQMPIMDGIQSARKIRSLETDFACSIIGLSANVLEDTRMEAKRAGFNDYLFKPVNVQVLRKALDDAYSRTQAQYAATVS